MEINSVKNSRKIPVAIQILNSPAYILFSTFITISSIVVYLTPAIFSVTLNTTHNLEIIDRILLAYIFLESMTRLFVTGFRTLKSHFFWIDQITAFPLFLELALIYLLKIGLISSGTANYFLVFPGILLWKSSRLLRLLFSIQFFYKQMMLGMSDTPIKSPLKMKIFTAISMWLFLFILLAGGVSTNANLAQIRAKKTERLNKISKFIKTNSLADTAREYFMGIIRIKYSGVSESYDINNIDPDYIKSHYRYGHDYIQVDNLKPGVSVQISFRDLNRQYTLLELAVIFTGGLSIAILLFTLNHYLDRMVIDPLNMAHRIIDLRMRGEDIRSIPGSTIARKLPDNEVTEIIQDIDRLYDRLTMQASPVGHPSIKEAMP